MIKTILSCLGRYKKAALQTPLFTALEVVMEVLLPFVTAAIIDQGIEEGNMKKICIYGGIMLVMSMASLIFGMLAGKHAATASAGLACNLRDRMYEAIQDFSFANIDRFSPAGLVTRMTTDVTNVQNAFQMIIRVAVRAPLMLVCSMGMCFFINARLSLIFVAAILFLGAVLFFIMTHTSKIFDRVFKKYDDLNASIQENVSAIRVVKAYVREGYENQKFGRAARELYRLFVKAEGMLAFNNPVMMLTVYGCMIGLSWFGAHFIVAGTMTAGELTSMFSYIMSVLMSLMMLSMIFVMITMSASSCRRIVGVLEEKPEMEAARQPVHGVKDGSIDFNHVSFSYKKGAKEKTLQDIDLHISAGETVGIIGQTGSGKTSLVNLISRLYDVTEGEVLVGGRNVKEYDMESLRNQVAVVLQKNVLFSGTILENLRWGREDATEEECRNACRQACAEDFIERFPLKYETCIEQGGSNVSGGQKQRLCIARALLKNPKVLILDDSTSAVDTATDARIRKGLMENIPGTTKLIIAQRVSSVSDADRILVLDGGRIGGFDTHERLLETNAIYREIYETQMKGNGDFDQASGGQQ